MQPEPPATQPDPSSEEEVAKASPPKEKTPESKGVSDLQKGGLLFKRQFDAQNLGEMSMKWADDLTQSTINCNLRAFFQLAGSF